MTHALAGRTFATSSRTTPDLVDRLIAHDEGAFDELVRKLGPRLFAVASRYLPNAADAEDALQEAFVNLMRSIDGFKRESSLETWMHRVVVNCALMSLRHRRRLHESALESTFCERVTTLPSRRSTGPSAFETLAKDEVRSTVLRELEHLPEAQRGVLLLHDVDGLELKEIASLLDLGLSTVKSRLHRARLTLHDALALQHVSSED